jgi:UDP-3-O-[3-hydroxymyristoyl] N-acetylglucosamine deacetylase
MMPKKQADTRKRKAQVAAAPLRSGIRQRTLNSSIGCTGIGLHSGLRLSMTLYPAEPDTGIVFHRTDPKAGGAEIPALWNHVVDTRMCTTLGTESGVTIGTIEHLMAAFAGCGIDNAVVELNGPEVPIMDGSAHPFVFLIECAGVREQNALRRVLRVRKPIELEEGERFATLLPAEGFSVSFDIDFASPAIARQSIEIDLADGTFKKEVARARTFGFMHEVEQLRAHGLALGGSLDNAVVVSGDKVLNEGGLRYDDEFVRHKVLDAVGDLYLAGAPIAGRFHGACSGHGTNNRLLRKMFADRSAWSLDICTEADLDPAAGQSLWAEGRLAVAAPA